MRFWITYTQAAKNAAKARIIKIKSVVSLRPNRETNFFVVVKALPITLNSSWLSLTACDDWATQYINLIVLV